MKFLWGAATSSHQVEGGNIHNDWWHWEAQGHIETGEVSGPATDHWNRFREDLAEAQELGLTSYRFSVEWSRIEPREGGFDSAALDWYVELVAECERRGLLPMLTLHHFTLPQWVAERGGFASAETPALFARFVERVVARLGPRIPLWCTVNEPMSLVVGAYLGAFMPPAVSEPRTAMRVMRNLFDAHVRAYEVIHRRVDEGSARRAGPWRHHPLLVGFAHNMIDFHPLRSWHPGEVLATRLLRRFYNSAWPDAVMGGPQRFGVRGLLPYPPPVETGLGRRTTDFFGINYYFKLYVRVPPYFETEGETALPEQANGFPVSVAFSKPGDVVSDLGWAIHPAGLGRMIRYLSRFGLPLYITENGIADREDCRRGRYLVSHLQEIAREIRAGADVRGYYHWSLLDNFEWVKGFTPRFGLLGVDYKTMARTRRPSADLLRRIIEEHEKAGAVKPDLALLEGVAR